MNPTDILRHEHRIVLMVLEGAEREARALESGRPPDFETIDLMVDFCRHFVDRCHHVKEEQCLFPAMRQRSPHASDGPIAVLLQEHKEGRRLVEAIAAGSAAAAGGAPAEALARDLVAYVDLMRAHTDKEDNVVFPLADGLLRPADQAALAADFERIEAKELGPGTHDRYHKMAHQLLEQAAR